MSTAPFACLSRSRWPVHAGRSSRSLTKGPPRQRTTRRSRVSARWPRIGTGRRRTPRGRTFNRIDREESVCLLLQKMAAGESAEALLEAYPQLSRADLQAVWEYAARSAAEEVVLAED